jgi:hypothetical protein
MLLVKKPMTNDRYRMTNKIVGQGFSLALMAVLLTGMFCLAVSCAPFIWTDHARQKKAQKEYIKKLQIVEKSKNARPVHAGGPELNEAIDELEIITTIRGHRTHGFAGTDYIDMKLFQQDFEKWKDWYEKNKNKLYWNEKQKRIIVKGSGTPENKMIMNGREIRILGQNFYLATVQAKDIVKIGDYTFTFYPDWCHERDTVEHKFLSPDFQKEISIEQKGTDYQLLLREKNEGSSSKVIDVSKSGFSAPDWNPASKKLVYLRLNEITEDFEYGDMVIFDITNWTRTILKRNLAYSDPKWSPEGTKIVFSDFGSIFIIDSDGKTETQIREGAYPEWCSGFCWSFHEDEIVFTLWTSVHHEELGKQILSIRIGQRE